MNATEIELGKRLREERLRLKCNQENFAEIGGVKKLAQINYEKGERTPTGSFLAAVAKIGVDVNYVITGKRTPNTDMPSPDSDEVMKKLTGIKRDLESLMNDLRPQNKG